MTDLEMTKLCAEAMGFENIQINHIPGRVSANGYLYWPLDNDAQAMALVKMFGLRLTECGSGEWEVFDRLSKWIILDLDLNRAIVECAAKMQAGK